MIHVMTLRDRRRAETRQAILDAAAELLAEEEPAALSMPAVADRSGVSLRTLYRYFATKTALVQAVSTVEDPAYTAGPLPALDGSDLHAWLRRGWSEEIQTPLLRAQLRSAAGVEVRRARRERHRAFAYAVLDTWKIGATGEAREALADLLLLLTGGAALVELTDVLGADPARAALGAAWAVEAILWHAKEGRLPDFGGEEFVMSQPKGDRS